MWYPPPPQDTQEAASKEIAPGNPPKPDQSADAPKRIDAPGTEYWLS
jgi:hypothetical protein